MTEEADCRLVIVRWYDSTQPISSWKHLSNLDLDEMKPIEVATVGWLLKDDADVKVIAQSVGGLNDESNVQANGIMTIPTCSIVSIENLAEVDEPDVRCEAAE